MGRKSGAISKLKSKKAGEKKKQKTIRRACNMVRAREWKALLR
jgi:hypothetical protein